MSDALKRVAAADCADVFDYYDGVGVDGDEEALSDIEAEMGAGTQASLKLKFTISHASHWLIELLRTSWSRLSETRHEPPGMHAQAGNIAT